MFEYNYQEIGERIRKEREKKGFSQGDLLNHIKDNGKPCFGRNVLSKIENGDATAFNAIKISHLVSLCETFNCSISYLLGEYTYRNYDNKFICEKTGLEESSLNALMYKKVWKEHKILKVINLLICNMFEKPNEKSRLSFFQLFANYIFYTGNNKEYSLDFSGKITDSIPSRILDNKTYYSENKLRFYSKQLEQMFIMEMNDELKAIKNNFNSTTLNE